MCGWSVMLGIGDSTASYIVKVSDFFVTWHCLLWLSLTLSCHVVFTQYVACMDKLVLWIAVILTVYTSWFIKGKWGGGGGRSNGWSYFSYKCLGMIWCIITQWNFFYVIIITCLAWFWVFFFSFHYIISYILKPEYCFYCIYIIFF